MIDDNFVCLRNKLINHLCSHRINNSIRRRNRSSYLISILCILFDSICHIRLILILSKLSSIVLYIVNLFKKKRIMGAHLDQ